ncbi:MAG: hypothetical protein RL398_438 [Planctomycetota bacterium]
MIRLEFPPAQQGTRIARIPGRLLTELRLWQPGGEAAYVTDDVESAAVLLHGTFDLFGNGTAWPARGARTTELLGRPMAVFLPPKADFRAHGPVGEIAVVAARRPDPEPEAAGREALSRKPLLPLAGSGKAFDPGSGEWKPAETFPTAAESLPPRRMTQHKVGDVVVERVFAPDYKAAVLSVDEAVLPPGASLALAAIPGRPPALEAMVLVRSEGLARIGDRPAEGGEYAWLLDAGEIEATTITAVEGRCYVLVAYAGK